VEERTERGRAFHVDAAADWKDRSPMILPLDPEWGPGAKPRQGVWVTLSPEDEEKCDVTVIFFTFPCTKFRIK